jgi:HEAT repeat protein/Uri superfamily endonuclease
MSTYLLALWLRRAERISVGRLGSHFFPVGWYLYVGSARGAGGVAARVGRHARRVGCDKRAYWHVDFLRERAVWAGAWAARRDEPLECKWAEQMRALPGARVIVRGFGASDCRCPAHLIHLGAGDALPPETWFAGLGAERIIVTDAELDELLDALSRGDDQSREAAALALGRHGQRALGRLARMIDDPDRDVRWWAARALAEIGGAPASVPLCAALADPDPDVRACAALALGQIRAGDAAPALVERLGDESAFVASIAADALSMIGDGAVDALIDATMAGSSHIRVLAVRALGRLRAQRAIGPLFGLLDDSSYLVRHYAREALEAMGVGMVFFSP